MRRERLREMESRVLFEILSLKMLMPWLFKQPSGDVRYRAEYKSGIYLL